MKNSAFTLVVNNLAIDTLPLFVQLAADTAAAYKEIDILFKSDKPRFEAAASRSAYAKCLLFTAGSLDRQIYAAKYLGMLLAAWEDGPHSPLFAEVLDIMTKRRHNLYTYLVSATSIDLTKAAGAEYDDGLAKKIPYRNLLAGAATKYLQDFATLYPAIDLPAQASLKFTLFIACILGKKVTVSNPETMIFIQMAAAPLENTAGLRQLKEKLNQPATKKLARYLKNAIFQKVYHNYLEPWSTEQGWEAAAHCSAYLSSVAGFSLVSSESFTSVKERDVELLCRIYIIKLTAELHRARQEKSQERLEADCAEFVTLGLTLLAFIREYKKARKSFLEQHSPYLYAELNNLKQQLTAYEAELRTLRTNLAAKTDLLSKKEAELNTLAVQHKFVIHSLSKETELLYTRLKHHDNQQEQTNPTTDNLIELTTANEADDLGSALNTLGSVQALVIGGTENWQTKLKSHFPKFVYLAGDMSSFDETLIIHADIIFANVRYKFSHDCFYKMIKLIRQHDKRLVFLSKMNISLTIRQMADSLSYGYPLEKPSQRTSSIKP